MQPVCGQFAAVRFLFFPLAGKSRSGMRENDFVFNELKLICKYGGPVYLINYKQTNKTILQSVTHYSHRLFLDRDIFYF